MTDLVMAIDEAGFRKAMSHFASGVTVVTTAHGSERFGMTVAAFASLSLRPPLVLVCIEKPAKTHDAIIKAECFAVNVLSALRQDISQKFASRSDDRFAGVAVRPGRLNLPLIEGSLANVECRLHASLPGGDHTIFVGEVIGAHISDGEDPLIYFRSGYRKLTPN